MQITTITKRSGVNVPFELSFVDRAIRRALEATNTAADAHSLAEQVYGRLTVLQKDTVTVEQTQDAVEDTLLSAGLRDTAKAYISYRAGQAVRREIVVADYLEKMAAQELEALKSPFAVFVYKRTYARFIPHKHRREFWPETVDRFVAYMRRRAGAALGEQEYAEVRRAIYNLEVMPSMRLLQFAGAPVEKNELYAFNCCFVAPTCLKDMRDIMYLLMCGTGVGFSVERRFVDALPTIAPRGWGIRHHVVQDSKEGWCDAFFLALETWWSGDDVSFDTSLVRPAGARLKNTGGKASGPRPLEDLLAHARDMLYVNRPADGRLTPLHLHSLICKIGSIVVAGSIRRSALISLSDLSDTQMRDCKSGAWWESNGHFGMANNSATYDSKPDWDAFAAEWKALELSGSGERGIFNRSNLLTSLPARRFERIGDSAVSSLGTNPCGEIVLQSGGLCNLSSVVCRPEDTVQDLERKVRVATIIGTFQSSLTNFEYVQPKFSEVARQECLLGVSLAGQMDCPAVRSAEVFAALKQTALATNAEYAPRFNVPLSTCVTTVKPDGTLGLITSASPGVHPAHAPFYIRRVRINIADPLCSFLKDQGVPFHPEVGSSFAACNVTTLVFEFPQRSSPASVCRHELSAIEHLEYWKMVKVHYTEHNPSVTISVRAGEWDAAGKWVYDNWDIVGGLSFLPYSDHTYTLAPYEDCSESEYLARKSAIGELNFAKLASYEYEDETSLLSTSACSGPMCSRE